LQDSPPAAGRSMRHLPFRRSAILPGGFFMSLEHYEVISYDIKTDFLPALYGIPKALSFSVQYSVTSHPLKLLN